MGLFTSYTWLISFTSLALLVSSSDAGISAEESKVWGPGLKSSFVVPARYFFIQAVDTEGNNFTQSPGKDAFSVSINYMNGAKSRVHTQVLDRNDGSFVVRFKLYQTSTLALQIIVEYDGRAVAESPYVLDGPVYHEKCTCPQPKIQQWLSDFECPAMYQQIVSDLKPFPRIDMRAVEQEAVSRFNQAGSHSLCHYVVKDNKVYRKTYGKHVGFKMFMDAMLLSLTRKVILPDLEFFVNLGDWPLERKRLKDKPIPILSWCGSEDTFDIILPTYDITESTLETMGRCDENVSQSLEMPTYEAAEDNLKAACRVSLDLLSVQGNTGPHWVNKSDLAFWRGRDSRQERLDLVKLSRKHPDIIDAKLTNMFFFKKDPEQYGELVKHISFFDFFKYKYQINIDGTVAAYRFPYLLAGDAVVFKHESNYYEFFYHDLVPYMHYIPYKKDLSDLLKQIQWAKNNQEEAQQIARNAQEFVRENLLADDIFCYHVVLFREYAKRLISKPTVQSDMELVEQPSDHDSQCTCKYPTKEVRLNSPTCGEDYLYQEAPYLKRPNITHKLVAA